MSDTKQKPDGWVIADKTGWFDWENVSLTTEEEAFNGICLQVMCGPNFKELKDFGEYVSEAKRRGWKARPFVFLDEGEK